MVCCYNIGSGIPQLFGEFFMSTNVPVTIWQPSLGNGEMGIGGNENITTLSGLGLTTLSGDFLITLLSTFTPIPGSTWEEDDSE